MSAQRNVLSRVSFETGVPVAALVGPTKLAAIARVRFAVYWLLHIALRDEIKHIGFWLDRDASSVRSGLRKANRLRDCDPAFRRLTDKLLAEFTGEA